MPPEDSPRRKARINARSADPDAAGRRAVVYDPGPDPVDPYTGALLTAMAGIVVDIVYIKDRAGIFRFANDACLAALGRESDEVIGHTNRSWIADEAEAAEIDAVDRHIMETGETIISEETLCRGGKTLVLRSTKSPVREADGSIAGVMIVSHDITTEAIALRRLRDSEARFKAAVEAVEGIMWTNDARGQMRGPQPGWGALTGQSEDEYAGFGWSKAVHPDDAQPTIEAWLSAVGSKRPFVFEHRVRRVDGVWRRFAIRAIPVLDDEGEIREWVGVHTDVTEAREREDQIGFLMRELSHRSKNALAVVQSLARQTGRTSRDVDEFLKRFDDRVRGMAASLDLLVERDWQGVSIAQLLKSQIGHYLGDHEHRLVAEGPDLLLTADATQNLGLALHELSTNAAKYGALSVASGLVKIKWRIIAAEGDEPTLFEIKWRESGGPKVKKPARKGFGQEVVQRLVQNALSGEVKLAFHPDGVKWRLTVPARQILSNFT
ncbi:MAG: PAS domain-containing protein [Xanthobacteraceae bacterium]|nr:PAS domain-containing protein [Xanthobacteraceae bacterium]